MYLECLLDILNQKLTVDSEKYAGAKYYGLAYQVSRDNQKFPVVLENKEQKEVVFDDSKPLIVYHRLLSKPYSKNDYGIDVATCQMVMVVYGSFSTANDVENQFISLIPESLLPAEFSTLTGLESVDFQVISSNLISEDVFNQEYKGVEYRLGENDFLFSIRYNIDVSFRKECLDFCESTYKTFCEQVAAASVTDLLACLTDAQTTAITSELCSSGSCDYEIIINGVSQGVVTLANCEGLQINVP